MIATDNYTLWVKPRMDAATCYKCFMQVCEFDVNTDMLSSTSSTIVCDCIPGNVEIGDFCLLVDFSGKNIFSGLIDTVEGNEIVALDLMTVFDYEVAYPKGWRWRKRLTTLHAHLFELANSQLKYFQRVENKYFQDVNQQAFFRHFRCTGEQTGDEWNFISDQNTIFNIYDEMMKVQEQGYVYVNNFNLTLPNNTEGFDADKSKITFACYESKPSDALTIIKNDAVNVVVTEEAPQYNKVSIFWETPRSDEPADTRWDRGCYYLGVGGRTENPSSPTRQSVTKNKVVFTDEPSLTGVLNAEMNRNLYNHKIEIDFFSDNGCYDFFAYKNGQQLNVLADNRLWQTVKTGDNIIWSRENGNVHYKIICGFVRNKATEFWFQKG